MNGEPDIRISKVSNGFLVTVHVPIQRGRPVVESFPSIQQLLALQQAQQQHVEYHHAVFLTLYNLQNFINAYYKDVAALENNGPKLTD